MRRDGNTLATAEKKESRFSLFPQVLIGLYAGGARNFHGKRAVQTGAGFRCVRNVDRSISHGGSSTRRFRRKSKGSVRALAQQTNRIFVPPRPHEEISEL